MNILIAIILASLPFISWYFQYYFSQQNGTQEGFQKHWTCYWGDWIFAPINALFIFSVILNSDIFILVLISIIANMITHIYWLRNDTSETGHMFRHKKILPAGWIHFTFSSIETTLLLSIFYFQPIFPHFYWEIILIGCFGFLMMFGSYKIHQKIILSDMLVGIGILMICIFYGLSI